MLFTRAGVVGALFLMPVLAQVNPGSYRHGLIPMVGSTAGVPAAVQYLRYRGGVDGVSVTTGSPRVYLVFWGTQWGTEGSDSNGYATFTGDPAGVAPDLQAFFKGLGTGHELWSGVMTQYCSGVAVGAIRCSTTNLHVGYPLHGALAGVWEDTSAAAPAQATAHQIAQEAENAAAHFGNTTTAANSNDQYLVISPTGTNPDNYKNLGFCAWHDYSGDTFLDGGGAVPGPLLAFSNIPYVPDVGGGCGAGFVNPGNNLDGVTIVSGHEYAETITDQFPEGGWLTNSGEEAADLCAWLTTGAGRSQNLTLTTGTFAVQGIWSNSNAACAISHAIIR